MCLVWGQAERHSVRQKRRDEKKKKGKVIRKMDAPATSFTYFSFSSAVNKEGAVRPMATCDATKNMTGNWI